jgi:hypothetical protein
MSAQTRALRVVVTPLSHFRQIDRSLRSSSDSPRSLINSPALSVAEKYQALASANPDMLPFVDETIEYLYDLAKRRNPELF